MGSVDILKLRSFVIALGEAVLKYEKKGKVESETANKSTWVKRVKVRRVKNNKPMVSPLEDDIKVIKGLIKRLNTKESKAFKLYAQHHLKKILNSNKEEAEEMAEKLIIELERFLNIQKRKDHTDLLEKKFLLREYLLALKNFNEQLRSIELGSKELTTKDKKKITLIKKRINRLEGLLLKKIEEINKSKRGINRSKKGSVKKTSKKKKVYKIRKSKKDKKRRKKSNAKQGRKRKSNTRKIKSENNKKKRRKEKKGRNAGARKTNGKAKKGKITKKKTIDSLIKS